MNRNTYNKLETLPYIIAILAVVASFIGLFILGDQFLDNLFSINNRYEADVI